MGKFRGKLYNFIVSIPLFSATSIALLTLTILASSVKAQSSCEPPNSDEYLLLIVTRTPEEQEKAKRSFPGNTDNIVCRYINDTVTRVGGFRNSQIAIDWVKYIKDVVGLPPQPAPGSEPIANPQTGNSGFNPQALGPGYAVLVDYFNQPELAGQVKQALGTQVGLASYGQRPFLFVAYTTDQNAATAAVKALSDRGFWPMLVDSRRVTVISPAVR
ncbi:MAG: hypothetical protein EAZ69_17480 [Oscillatoriales cyanobacterium]|nr:MAG: hypothetical protein EAZ69_17480 [Oscillatoriales cyanobacterium]